MSAVRALETGGRLEDALAVLQSDIANGAVGVVLAIVNDAPQPDGSIRRQLTLHGRGDITAHDYALASVWLARWATEATE